MAQLPLDQAITRFQQNDERLDKFANGGATESYVSSLGASVPSIQKFLTTKNNEINVGASSVLALATAQAENAEDSAIAAAASDASAVAAQEAAEAARDAAIIGAGVYDTEASGRAAVADGVAFKVQGGGDVAAYEYRRVSSSESTLIAEYPAASAFRKAIDESFSLLRNLFDPARASVEKYIDTVGGLSINVDYSASDWIMVYPSAVYNISNGFAAHFAYYTKAKTFISYALNVTSFTTPVNAAYIRFSQTNTAFSKLVLVKGSVVPSNYISFVLEDSATSKRSVAVAAQAMIETLSPVNRNLFDQGRAILDNAIDSAGNSFSTAGYFTTTLIPVTPGASYISSNGGQGQYFDEDKSFVSGFSVPTGSVFTPPAKAYYYRQHVYGNSARFNMVVVKGSTLPSTYSEFSSASWSTNLTKVREVIASYLPLVNNLFDKNRATDNTAVSNVNGASYTATGYYATDYIPVAPSGLFYSTVSGLVGAYYDINKNFVSGFSGLSTQPATVPSDVYFVRFQQYGLNGKDSLVVTSGTVPVGYVPFIKAGGSALPWQDKRLLVSGDSISYTGYWIPYFLSGTGMVLQSNVSVPGRAVRDMGKTAAGATLQSSDLTNVDFVVIFGGTNDYGGNRDLGTIADAFSGNSASTFYADVFNLLTLYYTLKPTLRIMFSTPLIRGVFETQPIYPAANSTGAKLPQYAQAIKEVCALFSTPVCDLFSVSGINLVNLTTYTVDNLHPNIAGGAMHARPMIAIANAA